MKENTIVHKTSSAVLYRPFLYKVRTRSSGPMSAMSFFENSSFLVGRVDHHVRKRKEAISEP